MSSSSTPAHYGGEPIRDEVLGYGSQSISETDKKAITEALEGDYITRGPAVEEFEQRVADFVGVDHAVASTSGTTALHLAGEAAGFESGDEVITTPLTFVSTAHVATYTGATPVFADIDPHRRSLDPDAVREQITDDTAGIVPMHYDGLPADIEELLTIADEHDLTVIWDACHAFGGEWRDELIGAQRDMVMFSFHPVKNITTGEGGMVVTDDDELAKRLRRFRSFDMDYAPAGYEDEPWYQVTEGVGYNYNFTDIQAALGLAQLDRIKEFKAQRDMIIESYNAAFEEVPGIRTPPDPVESDPMRHLYAIEVNEEFGCDRKEFINAMHAENLGVQVHYVPLHYHPYFQEEFGYEEGMFPVAEEVYDKLVSMPLHAEMNQDDIGKVTQAVERLHRYHN